MTTQNTIEENKQIARAYIEKAFNEHLLFVAIPFAFFTIKFRASQ